MNKILLGVTLTSSPKLDRTGKEVPFASAKAEVSGQGRRPAIPLKLKAWGEIAQALSSVSTRTDLVVSGQLIASDNGLITIHVQGLVDAQKVNGVFP